MVFGVFCLMVSWWFVDFEVVVGVLFVVCIVWCFALIEVGAMFFVCSE